jgi:hypothetical protein
MCKGNTAFENPQQTYFSFKHPFPFLSHKRHKHDIQSCTASYVMVTRQELVFEGLTVTLSGRKNLCFMMGGLLQGYIPYIL